MAEVRPLRAVHYNLAAVGSLADVVAPPYDVVSPEERKELAARSPFNVVEIDLPVAPEGADPYEHAGETFEEWMLQGILTADREPTIWALTQEYVGPDGSRLTRRGFLAAVRVSDYDAGLVRPHERTQPGPKEDRLRLTRATRHNLSPIFALYPGNAWPQLEEHTTGEPWATVADADGTTHRVWPIADPTAHEAVASALDDAELLIADGHHRYETSLVYADEVGGEGPHRFTLMCLASLEDSGLTVFPTHRLLSELDLPRQEALAASLRTHFDIEEVPLERLDPGGEAGIGVFGYIDSHFRRAFRIRLKDAAALERALPEASPAYRALDAVILEELILKQSLRMSEDDIAGKRGIGYTHNAEEAVAALGSGYDAAFLLRPTPVEQVRAVAQTGMTMPPKSTYFWPKLLTGIVFNPLS